MKAHEQHPGDLFGTMERRIPDSEVNAILKDAIDMHVHTAPSIRERPSIIDLAQKAYEMGLAAFVAKRAEFPTVTDAEIANQIMNGKSIEILGSIVLNRFVGGLNPSAVQEAVSFQNCKVVWMPTTQSAYHFRLAGKQGGIEILTQKGQLKDEVKEILEIVAKARQKICIASGHVSFEETLKLVEACTSMSIPVVATHVTWPNAKLTLNEMKEIIEKGGYLELCVLSCIPSVYNPNFDVFQVPEIINNMGSENIVLSTDYGQPYSPNPVEGFRFFIRILLTLGMHRKAIETMIKVNPRKILDMDKEATTKIRG